jgi:hypothetical protein
MVSLNFKKEKHDSLNTRQGDVNLYVILLVVLILAHSSFAQEEAAQTSVPADQSGTSDVVEMESDLGVGDMKMGGTTKDNKLELKSVSPAVNSKSTLKGIKPSANYKTKEQGPEATDQKQIKDVSKANLSEQQLQDQRQKKMDERMKAAEADLDDAIESDVVKKTPTVEEFIPSKPDAVLTDKQVVMISESLRKLIDENDQLKKQLSDVEMGKLTGLLKKIHPAIKLERKTKEERHGNNHNFVDLVAEINVRVVMNQIGKKSGILSRMAEKKEIAVIGGMYDVATGVVTFAD